MLFLFFYLFFFFFNDTAPTEIYTVYNTLSLHDALPISTPRPDCIEHSAIAIARPPSRSEEHTSELQSLYTISYAVFCLKKKKKKNSTNTYTPNKQTKKKKKNKNIV